jgi:tRNA(Ile)-lysidine synthase
MAGSKSSPCPEIAPETASSRLQHTLSAFLAARLAPGERLCVGLSGGRDSVVLLHALDRPACAGPCRRPCRHPRRSRPECQRRYLGRFLCRVLPTIGRAARHRPCRGAARRRRGSRGRRSSGAPSCVCRLLCRLAGAGAPSGRSGRNGPLSPVARGRGRGRRRHARRAVAGRRATPDPAAARRAASADRRLRRREFAGLGRGREQRRLPLSPQPLAPGRAAAHRGGFSGRCADAGARRRPLCRGGGAARRTGTGRSGDRCRGRRANRSSSLQCPAAGARAQSPAHELSAAGWRAPEARWLDEALRQLASVGSDSQTCIATPDGEVNVYRRQLYVCARRPPLPAGAISWLGEARLAWGDLWVSFVPTVGAGVSRGLLAGTRVCLRRRQGGERLQVDARRPRRTLANLLQEAGVPPWERARLPLLWSDDRLVWVGGIGVDASFACREGEAGIVVAWENVAPCTAANGTAAG